MPQFPSKWLTVVVAHLCGHAQSPDTCREKTDALEAEVTKAAEACIDDGFVPAVNPAVTSDGNIIVFIHPSAPVQRQPGQIQPASPAMVPHLLQPPTE